MADSSAVIPSAVVQRPDARWLTAAVFGLALANGIAGDVAGAVQRHGLAEAALAGFGLDVVVVLAGTVALRLALGMPAGAARPVELWAALAVLPLMLLPDGRAAWVGLGLFSAVTLVTRRTPAAWVGLALCADTVLRNAVLNLFVLPLTSVEARAVSVLLDALGHAVTVDGNIVAAGENHHLVVIAGCSSLLNLSAGLLCWTAVTLGVAGRWTVRALAAGVLVALAMVGLNLARLAAMASAPGPYQLLHEEPGATLTGLAALAVAAAISLAGIRHGRPS